jgi:dihydropteroate synthase
MGVVNVTPDSFSDGGRLTSDGEALDFALRLVAEGADIIDVGGESSRPGATPIDVAEELRRVVPLISAIKARSEVEISIDTTKPQVARAAITAGASMWNDISALRGSSESLAVAASLNCQVVLMHMKGDPATMQDDPLYEDVVGEVAGFLAARAAAAEAAGVAADRIWLDPGIGFGKTPRHSLTLLRSLSQITALGYRVLVGTSRKGFIRAVDPSARQPQDRLGGSLATGLAAARSGAAAVRAHDVRQTVQALRLQAAIAEAGEDG